MLAPSSVCIPSVCANPGLAVRVRGSARARTYDDRVKEIELAFHRKGTFPSACQEKSQAHLFSPLLLFSQISQRTNPATIPIHYSTTQVLFSTFSSRENRSGDVPGSMLWCHGDAPMLLPRSYPCSTGQPRSYNFLGSQRLDVFCFGFQQTNLDKECSHQAM